MRILGRDLSSVLDDPFRKSVWDGKYGGDIDGLFSFMAEELGNSLYHDLFMSGKALPGGRILATFSRVKTEGKDVKLTAMNCYVIPVKYDSVEGIFDCIKELAKTFSWGGGCGTDLSALRPNSSPVRNVARTSTGPVSFLPSFHQATEGIGQHGRRGAFLCAMHVAHPDILDFVKAKVDGGLSSMNISVKIPDYFMEALSKDMEVELWYPHAVDEELDDCIEVEYIADCYNHPNEHTFFVKADQSYRYKHVYSKISTEMVWEEISKAAWACGDPGIIFWDTILKNQKIPLHCVNPCGELPLVAYGACCLGSVNLSKFVDPNTKEILTTELKETTATLTEFLNDVLNYSIENDLFPLPQQREAAAKYKPIGVGITGLADALILANIEYGSDESLEFVKKAMEVKRQAEISAGKEENCQLSTVAPAGSTSLVLGCSTGIEPNFAFEYHPEVNFMSKLYRHPLIDDLAAAGIVRHENVLVEAHSVDPISRVKMQGIIQGYVDGSISSTVNLPRSTSKETIQDIYRTAFDLGCKGVTVFREGSKPGYLRRPERQHEILPGKTIKVPFDHPWYITLNLQDDEPTELFINVGKDKDSEPWTTALARVISNYLQTKEGSVERIIRTMYNIRGEEPFIRRGWAVQSGPDAIAKALSLLLASHKDIEYGVCPSCEERGYIVAGGCGYCEKCGYSKCD